MPCAASDLEVDLGDRAHYFRRRPSAWFDWTTVARAPRPRDYDRGPSVIPAALDHLKQFILHSVPGTAPRCRAASRARIRDDAAP